MERLDPTFVGPHPNHPVKSRGDGPRPWVKLGIVFGLLSATAIVLYGPIGVSSTYPRAIGALLRLVSPVYAATNPYLIKMGSVLTPETFLVLGLFIGGLLGAMTKGTAKAPAREMIHAWETTAARRYGDAFVGGVLIIIFGARMAGGCTSGHIISGITQLSVGSILFAVGVFASGLSTARLIKGRR